MLIETAMKKIMKPLLFALIVTIIVFLCASALFFLPKHTSQFKAYAGNLSTTKSPSELQSPRFIVSSGPHGSLDAFHEWNRTKYGLIWHWHITDVAAGDPLEYYREIDLAVVDVYVAFALILALFSGIVTFLKALRWKRGEQTSEQAA